MGKTINIERNKIDYLLTDIMPVEVSELFSYGKFYEYLMEHQNDVNKIINELMKEKSSGKKYLFNGGNWASAPLKFNILKGVNQQREINLVQPISALNIYFFIECYQKEILTYLENNCYFSLRYHRKNNNLYYKRKNNRMTEYFSKTSKKVKRGILQQTGAYFRIHKFNSVTDFTNSRMWQMCNSKYRYFAKADYKSCFNSIYTHSYKWIIERNTTDSKAAKNANRHPIKFCVNNNPSSNKRTLDCGAIRLSDLPRVNFSFLSAECYARQSVNNILRTGNSILRGKSSGYSILKYY